jgi:localization factor PodJL
MSAAAPWSVKGIDPKAREIAKDLARRSGMTLGEWLNQVILEDGAVDIADEPAPAPRQTFTGRPYSDQAFAGRGTFGAASAYRRIETPEHPGDEVFRVTEALDRLSARIEAAEHRSTLAISGIDQSVSGLVTRLASAEREQTAVAARFEGAVDDLRVEQARVVERLRRTEQEAVGPRSVEALRSMEGALAKVAGHLYEGEARTRETLSELRRDIDQIVDGGSGVAANADLIEGVVARISQRLEQAEAKTTEAMRGLESSFANLDGRLGAAEARLSGRSSDAGLEQLAASLSARVDAARVEMAEKIRATADGRFERMERTIEEMTGHVQAAERRSASAIERMGHEVLRMADTLNRKVEGAESRSTAAIEQVGGEVARMADAMENRLGRIDGAGAQALEKLGTEIARITERLTERIASAERRSAQAIDDVGETVSRISERLQDKQERTSSELADRIRQSEERTARLLEDARQRIDTRLAETQRRAPDVADAGTGHFGAPAFGAPSFGASGFPDPAYAPSAFADAGFSPTAFSESRFPDAAVAPFGEQTFGEPPAAPQEPEASAPRFGGGLPSPNEMPPPLVVAPLSRMANTEPFGAAEPFGAPESLSAPEPFGDDLAFQPAQAQSGHDRIGPDGFLIAEDPLEAALAASSARPRAALFGDDAGAAADQADDAGGDAIFAPPPSTKSVIEQARAAARASSEAAGPGRGKAKPATGGSLFGGFGRTENKAKPREGSTIRTALLMSGAAAAAGVMVAGYELLGVKPSGALPSRVADALNHGPDAKPTKPLSVEVGEPLAAMAMSPKPLAPGAVLPGDAIPPAASKIAAPSPDAAAFYADGAKRIETHDNTGIEGLRKSANLGYAPAQFYLAKLYENGEAGLKKDLDEARRWTERAAEGGDRKAMHNLALYYFEGQGGAKNTTIAAQWFRRAADLGLVDSQYNLGRLYEEGFGVSQNPAEAYKWYLIAAKGGDAESRASAQRLKRQLSAEAQSAAERAAGTFQAQGPKAPGAMAELTPGAAVAGSGVVNAQKALSRLGYYQGPADGAASPALKLAIAAYQRDQRMQPTGQVDVATAQLFAAIAQ